GDLPKDPKSLSSTGSFPDAVELLHTYLIGNDKYVWHDTSKSWDRKKEVDFAIRLSASSIDGLTLPPVRAEYITQYKNSLIGKHFKTLQQLAVFHLQPEFCSSRVLKLWKVTGELGAMLWYPEIKDMEEYLRDLRILIDNLLDTWAEYDPRRILYKMKLHTLDHLPDNIRRHGPTVLYSTEVFECWNAIFRMCSVLSNHLAPSRDIVATLADMERFKHQVSGGWWMSSKETYVQAGRGVRSFMQSNTELQRRLGWVDAPTPLAGAIRPVSRRRRSPVILAEAIADKHTDPISDISPVWSVIDKWCECKYAVSQSHEHCMPGSWVFFRSDANTAVERAMVIIDQFDVADRRDTHLNMPILSDSHRAVFVRPQDILFKFNAQHDCWDGKCPITAREERVQQERQTFTSEVRRVSHSNDTRFLINMHAMHNASLIRETLPRTLVEPVPYFKSELRRFKHDKLAEQLRVTGPIKRAATAAKAKATREKNKAGKDNLEGPHVDSGDTEGVDEAADREGDDTTEGS
ncbi:hypothetical protein OF83DRAFT_1088541, partial [Amylostereum chailletii]